MAPAVVRRSHRVSPHDEVASDMTATVESGAPRNLPVRPVMAAIDDEVAALLRDAQAGTPRARAAFAAWHATVTDLSQAMIDDARLVIAKSYQAPHWTRLVEAVQLADAIWRDDLDTVTQLITHNPALLHEHVLVRTDSNWGAPLSYTANVGHDRILTWLYHAGATDLDHALQRAALQGQLETAKLLHQWLGTPKPPDDSLGGPAYTLSVGGTALLLHLGARAVDENGRRLAPVEVVLSTDSRNPAAKHAILEMYAAHGVQLPDTAPMALHRGRIDLLEQHLARDPGVLARRFRHTEIFPVEMGCQKAVDATIGTPLDGTTLLHMAIDFDELEIVQWLIAQGADVNARATVGASGFGGYTPLFCTVVSQPNFWMNYHQRGPFTAPFTELLLANGAEPNVRASLWKELHPGYDIPGRFEYHDVTALSWGRRFHAPVFVSAPAMALIEAAGGTD
ncbi:MAG: ankyrin repeat domain-containing protein [Gemmatimonadota bacterium]